MKTYFINQYRREIIICCFLIIATMLVYGQVGSHSFIDFDDPEYITENVHVKTGVTWENIVWAFTSAHSNNWHPLTWISHMIDVQLFGLDPGKHHLVNVFIHIVNSLLLFLLFRVMTKSIWPSAFVAILFALHPLHVESVAWASERKDVLSTFFWIVTIAAYVRYTVKPDIGRYLPVFIFLAFGLMAKQMLVTLPFVLLLLDVWPLRRISFGSAKTATTTRKDAKRKQIAKNSLSKTQESFSLTSLTNLVMEKIPLLILSITAGIIVFLVQSKSGTVKSLEYISLPIRLENAIVSYLHYLWQMLWPVHLSIFYPHPESLFALWKIGSAVLLLLIISALVIYHCPKKPYLFVGWFWYLGTLVPVIGLVQVGVQAMADRYTYIPLIGIFIMIAWGVSDLTGRLRYRREIIITLSAFIIALLAVQSERQSGYWKTNIDLYRHALEVTDNNYWAYNNLGAAIGLRGDIDGAINYFSRSSAIHPQYLSAQKNMAIALYQKGDYKEALRYLEPVVKKNPQDIAIHYLMAMSLEKTGDADKAAEHFREVLRLQPADIDSQQGLQRVLTKGKYLPSDQKKKKYNYPEKGGQHGLRIEK
jgi:tetratricopeptide (TPR) repeat protein